MCVGLERRKLGPAALAGTSRPDTLGRFAQKYTLFIPTFSFSRRKEGKRRVGSTIFRTVFCALNMLV